jgi:hypothetical protein
MTVNQGSLPAKMGRASLFSFLIAMHPSQDRCERSPKQPEASARAAIEVRAGRSLADAEWAAMRTRLLEFAGILRVWDRKTTASRRGNVEVLCQREP